MKIKINNKQIETFESGKLLEVARRYGVDIPALCYAPGYKHQASCMVCVVKDCETGQIIPSCSTEVVEGMNIDTESDEVINLRREALEMLLSDHIAVCRAPCEPKNCKLRQYANTYRAKWNRYSCHSTIKETQPQHVKGSLWFDVAKCIRCGLCIYNSNDGFTFKNRGFEMQVVLPEESVKNIDESLWKICSTQALYVKT